MNRCAASSVDEEMSLEAGDPGIRDGRYIKSRSQLERLSSVDPARLCPRFTTWQGSSGFGCPQLRLHGYESYHDDEVNQNYESKTLRSM